MNVESLREYCLSLPLATEDFPFDETTLVFRVVGKIFAMLDLERPDVVSLKCNPDYALQLREEHPEISGAWHMNKKYWNQVNLWRNRQTLWGGCTDANPKLLLNDT